MKGNFMSIAKVSSILANRIRVIRNSKGWTQQRLAQEINVHPTYISRIESCNKLPTLYIITRIAEVLDVEAYELLLEDEKLDTSDYKKKKIINILRESSPSNINIYFPLISALHKERKKNKKHK
ncbi:MAG: helix-turn-helix transcriptional regulator [Candidatus Omnitrophica bacterium]|nr:helix-turn-helix transcriptional regulator [Candidatus Omnitrophota bacterium]